MLDAPYRVEHAKHPASQGYSTITSYALVRTGEGVKGYIEDIDLAYRIVDALNQAEQSKEKRK